MATKAVLPRRADPTELKAVFDKYASVKKNDERFMSPQDFVSRFLHAHTDIQLSNEATKLLAGVMDQKKDGLVSCITLSAISVRKSDGLCKMKPKYLFIVRILTS
ncbi:hypothetical protein LDENG_00240690 [Lucifuga dentata]|nr:hypothetical protein LDENG_00240690 [Lucifuga dentata]